MSDDFDEYLTESCRKQLNDKITSLSQNKHEMLENKGAVDEFGQF